MTRPSRILKACLMENNRNQIEEEENCLNLSDSGWSIEELIEFGIENVINVTDNFLFTRVLLTYPRKTLGELIELFDLVKNPFNIRFSKTEYRKLQTNQEKKSYLEDLRYEMVKYLIGLLHLHMPEDIRLSEFGNIKKSRFTLRELSIMLK